MKSYSLPPHPPRQTRSSTSLQGFLRGSGLKVILGEWRLGFEGLEGLEGFENFEGLEDFEGFEGFLEVSIF